MKCQTRYNVIPVKPQVHEGVHEIGEKEKMYVEIPNGASELIYTVDGNDPGTTDKFIKTAKVLDLVALLKDQPNVKVKLRAVDQDGNVSDVVNIELVSKARKYDFQLKPDLFGEEVTFKKPDDEEGFFAVLKSLIRYGCGKDFLSKDNAQRIEELITKIFKTK